MAGTIDWPRGYGARDVAVRVSNAIAIDAPPDVVWAILVRAGDWPLWYPNSTAVAIDGGGADLVEGARFTWRTFGARVTSTVHEFVAPVRIAWDGTGLGLDVYHAWLIEPEGDGCRVLTEEHQNGLAARALSLFAPNRMHEGHQLWLERLKARAEARAA